MTDPNTANPPTTPPVPANGRRRRALLGITGVIVLAGLAYTAYWALVLNHYESTDNAYVQGNVVQVTPQVGGTVLAIAADDTDRVNAGQVIVRFDATDARIAFEQAQEQLAQAVREVRGLYANDTTLSAQIKLREADLARAESDLARTRDDVQRRAPLVASGAVGREELEHARAQQSAAQAAVSAAQAAIQVAREQRAANQVQTSGTTLENHPVVARAASRVRDAALTLSRTEVRAPIDGFVAKRSVQLGQRVAAGTPMLAVIGLKDVWVEANFKENQLRNLRLGQPVALTADVYGDQVNFHGRIEGLGAGTGAAFALLPAQNASGNWIKVVQRIPVRIALDPKELATHPLRLGMSMLARVDISQTDGPVLAPGTRAPSVTQTRAFEVVDDGAEGAIRRIIAANGGRVSTIDKR